MLFLGPDATYNCVIVARFSYLKAPLMASFVTRYLVLMLACFITMHGAMPGAVLAGQTAVSERPVAAQVALVRVHLPLTGSADQVLEATIGRLRDRLTEAASRAKDARRPTLILQLEPHRQEGEGSQFERAFALARFLSGRKMAGVKTVAFVPRSIRGHGVLLALACEEIVMAADATLGEAGIDEAGQGVIGQTVVGAYREIAESRRTMPVALALGMIDGAAEVLLVETEKGTEFVLRSELESLAQQREVIDERVLVPAGTMASFEGREGREFGFVKFLATDRNGLARALDVPLEAIREEDTLAGEWVPTMIDLRGPITHRMANQMETMLSTAIEQNINWIGLRIDSAGGDLAASVRIATTLARLDANSVRTVGYVPAEATGGAALVALACDQLVMHPEARLGAASPIEPSRNLEVATDQATELAAARTTVRESLAPRTERSWSLLAAMIDPGIEVFQYRNKATGETRWMNGEEAAGQEDFKAWQRGAPLVEANEALLLDGEKAEQLGLVWQTVDSFDALKDAYHLTEDPPVAKPNWALELIEALASPEFSVFLLMAGFAGIYIELRTPGVGVGAFFGSVALLLYFWSQYLHGTAGWLEVLLFLAGVSFILMEIVVLPGFGIFGLGGGAMVLSSIILASLTFIRPRSEQDMEALASSVGMVAMASVGMIVCVLISRRFLPQAPLFNKIVLDALPPEEQAKLDHSEMLADYEHLVGRGGVAATHLRPAGKAEIDHQLIDVIAESDPLDRGTPLVVVEAHANRVIVRATGPA